MWFSSSHFTHLSTPPTHTDWNSCHLMVPRKQTTQRILSSSESNFSSNCVQRLTSCLSICTKWSHIHHFKWRISGPGLETKPEILKTYYEWNFSTITKWIVIKFDADIYSPIGVKMILWLSGPYLFPGCQIVEFSQSHRCARFTNKVTYFSFIYIIYMVHEPSLRLPLNKHFEDSGKEEIPI